MRVGKIVYCTLACLIFSSASLFSQVPTGQLYGTVTDEQGTPLPGVSVEATSPKLVGRAATVSAANGIYRLFSLTPGIYRLTYALQGFKSVTRDGIAVGLEQAVKLDIRMILGALEENVTVVGRSPLIDVKSTTRETTLVKDTFELLPRGRNFDTLVSTVPGVSNEVLLAGLSVDGASGAENMFHIDGTDITNLYTGVSGQNGVIFEFVDEVQIKASGYTAEFGGSLGGVVNVITRQGGNAFHGDVIGYYSGSALTGRERDSLRLGLYDTSIAEYVNYQDLYGKDEIDRLEAGFSLGGYIVKDKLWFFGSILPVSLKTKRHVLFESTGSSGYFDRKDASMNFHLKLTAQPFDFLRLGASVVNNFSKFKGDLPPRDGTGDPASPWPNYGLSYPNWSAAFHADFTFGNNALLSLRAGSFYSNTTDQLVTANEPNWTHSGFGNSIFPDIPAEYIRPYGWTNMPWEELFLTDRAKARRSSVNADFSYYLDFAGEHAWKLGVQWTRAAEDFKRVFSQPYVELMWGWPYVTAEGERLTGTYGTYLVLGSELTGTNYAQYKVHSDRWAFYLQDSWTIKNRLTLNLGLRAEREYIPSYSGDPASKDLKPIEFSFADKLAPRIGIIYDVFGDSSLKVFADYGIYYDVMKLYMAPAYLGGGLMSSAIYALDTYEWDKIGKNGYFPGDLLKIFGLTNPGSYDFVDPELRPMSQREITFGIEKKIIENLSATVRVVQKHLRFAIEDVGVIETGRDTLSPSFVIANPGYGYSRKTTEGGLFDPKYPGTPKARREYWAVNIGLDKRFSNNWLAGFSYTWSRLTGNYSGLASSDEEGRNGPNIERNFDFWFTAFDKTLNPIDGPLATDRTHVFKLYGAYTFSGGLTVGAVVNGMSGIPVTETWRVFDPFENFMPYGRGNLGRTPFLWFANLYAEYSLKLGKTRLSFNVNIDNMFNTGTATAYYKWRPQMTLEVSEEQLLANNWQLETSGFVPDPQFNKGYMFYPPIAARFGIRYGF